MIKANPTHLVAFTLALLAGTAVGDPEVLDVHHCMPINPEIGDYRLEGGLLQVMTETEANQPTPGFVGASLWIDGLGWISSDQAATLSGGNLANRVDLVFVGDGYRAADLGLYHLQVASFADQVFAEEPLFRYRPLFTVHRVDVISVDWGVTNDPVQGISRNTAMQMNFWCNGTERLLCVNVALAKAYANNAMLPPGGTPDQIIALANSSKYGGAGYSSQNLGTAAAGNGSAAEIVVHELGHSMANLADEYDYGGPAIFTGPEPTAANASKLASAQMAAQNTKWASWLGENQSVWDGNHSTFQGAVYSTQGIYRPTDNSKMRSLFRKFNLVSAEAFIKEIYRIVSPVDSFGPTQSVTEHMELYVVPVRPIGQPLEIQWFLNGEPIAGAIGESLDTQAAGLSGTGSLTVRVRDTTPWMRDEAFRNARMTKTIQFSFNLPQPCLGDIADDFGLTAADGGGPDGVVDFGDFAALLGLIGPCAGGVSGCLGDIADDFGLTAADGGGPDGVVDFGDFAALLGLIGPC